jgi:rhodanese-related sulfurtransferase
MVIAIDRDEVQRLLDRETAQLIEVLPAAGYTREHIPGAVNIPLKELNGTRAEQLVWNRPVIVYCYDSQ